MPPPDDSLTAILLRMLLNPLEYERTPLLIARVVDEMAQAPRSQGVFFLKEQLADPQRSLVFHFVLLQVAAQLAWPELLDVLGKFILSKVPIQLQKCAFQAVVATKSLPGYCLCLDLVQKSNDKEICEMAALQLEQMAKLDPIIFHYHALLHKKSPQRDPFAGLEELAGQLDDCSRRQLIPMLRTHHGLELAALARLVGITRDRCYLGPMMNRIMADWRSFPEAVLREMLLAICGLAATIDKRDLIRQRLRTLQERVPPAIKTKVLIWILPLLSAKEKLELMARFMVFSVEEKQSLLLGLGAEDEKLLLPILLKGLEKENDEELFARYLEILIKRGLARQCLDLLERFTRPRRSLLLRCLCSGAGADLSNDLLPYFHAKEEDELLVLMAENLLVKPSKAVAARAWDLLQSGVTQPVQSALIRRLPEWIGPAQLSLEALSKFWTTQTLLRSEWLVSFLRVLELERNPARRLQILEGVLVAFENMQPNETIHFVQFFKKMSFQSSQELGLVRDEVKLLVNTMLNTVAWQTGNRALAELLRELEKREIKGGLLAATLP